MADFSDAYSYNNSIALQVVNANWDADPHSPAHHTNGALTTRQPRQLTRQKKQSQSNNMATGGYNFPPPPPPPGGPHQQQPQYGYNPQQPQYQQQPRGGGPPRGGRGGPQGGRGDFHGPPYSHQPNGYSGPAQNHGPPQNQAQPPPYNPHNPAAGFNQGPGPQTHGPQQNSGTNGGGYSGPQWQGHQQHHGPPHQGPPPHHPQQPPMQHTPTPAPLSAQNYHPNFAPQGGYQQPQYGPQQPPQFQNSHQPPYSHSGPPNQHTPQQWSGPPQHGPPQFNNRGRGRGGFEAPLAGPPIRMGFDKGNHMAQAGNGFTPQYPPNNHQSPPVPFNQPTYQGYPQSFVHGGQRPPLDPTPFNSGPHRGRGNTNFRGRGRNDFNSRGSNGNHQSNGHRATSENFHKPTGVDAGGKKKKKRKTNTLGLTPNGADHDESEDDLDEVDEEARLVTLLGPDTPQLPTDLVAWLAERKSRFPTKARREAAAEEQRLRREQGRSRGQPIKKEEETKFERDQRKAEKLRLQLEKLERNISGAKRKRENGDEGDEDRGQVSDSGSEASSDDADQKPEAMSSRMGGPMRMPPPPKAQLQRHCKYFSTGGTCGKKGKCRFVHDQEVRNQALKDKEANGGKMTLAQRLILNDTAKDDLTILKSIKYLKEKGLMSDQVNASAKNEHDGGDFKTEENNYIENLSYGET